MITVNASKFSAVEMPCAVKSPPEHHQTSARLPPVRRQTTARQCVIKMLCSDAFPADSRYAIGTEVHCACTNLFARYSVYTPLHYYS